MSNLITIPSVMTYDPCQTDCLFNLTRKVDVHAKYLNMLNVLESI